MAAPATAIVAHDLRFYEHLPQLYPFADARSWFEGNEAKIQETAFRNGTLQGAYLIVACRALGLDCGPMSGFDNAAVDKTFFAGGTVRRSEEHTSELQSLMRISYAVFCMKKKIQAK